MILLPLLTALEKDLDDIPDGPTFPLNSKRLNATRIRRIAESLGVPIGAAADEICQMLGEKLRGMGHDPTNVQVVIEGDDNLYAVDNTGIILHIKSHEEGHVGRHEEGHTGGHVTKKGPTRAYALHNAKRLLMSSLQRDSS